MDFKKTRRPKPDPASNRGRRQDSTPDRSVSRSDSRSLSVSEYKRKPSRSRESEKSPYFKRDNKLSTLMSRGRDKEGERDREREHRYSPEPKAKDGFKRSKRIAAKKRDEMDALTKIVNTNGSKPEGKFNNDLTPHLLKTMKQGDDLRFYVTQSTRSDIKTDIENTRKIYNSQNWGELPTVLQNMFKSEQVKKSGHHWLSTRDASDGYRKGDDYSFTFNQDIPTEKRKANDTPRPRSPSPVRMGENLPLSTIRYEHAHQDSYRFTGLPGHTVHAPTQANQAIDTVHERFAAEEKGGFVFRHDTFNNSTLFSGRPRGDGEFEIQHSTNLRRFENKKDGKS